MPQHALLGTALSPTGGAASKRSHRRAAQGPVVCQALPAGRGGHHPLQPAPVAPGGGYISNGLFRGNQGEGSSSVVPSPSTARSPLPLTNPSGPSVAAGAVAVAMPETAASSPTLSAHQLLQYIASATDWRHLRTLFHEHQDTLTTAHVAAITMQLPAASHPNNPDLGSDVCIISEGLQAVALELMNRLEGQLHVLPARLLLGVSAALDSCSMPRTPTWRCAFLSAAASLVATHSSAAIAIGPAAASLGSATGPAASHSCSEAEVLSLARIICTMFTEEGSSEEALCSAALTERLVAVLRAAGGVASAAPAALAAQGVRERITGVRDAAEQLLHGEGALARIEAYPARVVLQVMDALVALGVQPSQQWLAAASAGLAVSARGPQQLVAGESLLARLGFDPTQQHMFVVQPSPIPAQASSSSCSDGLALASQQPSFDELAGPGSALAAAAAAATLSAAQQQQQQAERRASHSSASSSSGGSAGRSSSPSRSSSPGAGGNMGSSSGSVTAPSSALEGMAVLLSDAAASGMLPELKASVFSDLDGCDPALVLWSAEAFHQLGCPLTGRELARCVHLALDAIGASSNGGFAGPAAVSPLDVMILVQRCCSQGAPVPPGQLEVLLEYAMEQRRIMTPEQLAELLGAVAAVVARGAPDGASAGGTLCAVAEQDRRRAFGASWDDEDERGAGAVLDEDEEELLNGGASFGSSSSSSMECRAMDGALVSSVVSLLQPHLGSLGAGEAARLAGVLTTLRACGNAAARPQPAWLDAFCTAVQPQLPHLEPGQLRQVLALLATPTPARTWAPGAPFVQGCLAAATRLLKQAVPQVAKTGKLEGDARDIIPDTVAVLEHLVLDLACGGGQGAGQLAAGVAEHLAPALRTHAGALSASQAAGALRLLSVLRCRNEASRAAAAALAARLLDVPSPAAGATSKAASAGIRTLWPGRLAMVMWACGELGVKLSDTQLPVLLDTARAALPRMPPRALALLGRALVRLGVVPDQAFQVAYRDALLVAMPSSDAETLSLMCITLIHMGMVPDAQWRRAFIIESTFRMADADSASVARFAHFLAECGAPPPCEWVEALTSRALSAPTHTPDVLPMVLHSLVRLGWAPEAAWLQEALQRIAASATRLHPASIIAATTCIASLVEASADEFAFQGACGGAGEACAWGITGCRSAATCSASAAAGTPYIPYSTALDALLQGALARAGSMTVTELRGLLDPLIFLNAYELDPELAHAFQVWLSRKETEEEDARWDAHAAGLPVPQPAPEPDLTQVVGLMHYVSPTWLAAALVA